MPDLQTRLARLRDERPGITQAEAACELLCDWRRVAALWDEPQPTEAPAADASAGCGAQPVEPAPPVPGTMTPAQGQAPQPSFTYRSRPLPPMRTTPREYRKPRRIEHEPGCW